MTVTISGNGTFTGTSLTANNIAANTITSNNILSTSRLVTGNMPAGSILQVVNFVSTTYVGINSGSFTATGYTATITPTSSSSKVLFLFGCTEFRVLGSVGANIYLYRNGSVLTAIGREFGYSGGGGGTQSNATFGLTPSACYLDSPATTSATTYAIYAKILTSTGTLEFLPNGSATVGDRNVNITLMEIAG